MSNFDEDHENHDPLKDRRIVATSAMVAPEKLHARLPLTAPQAAVVLSGRRSVGTILQATDDRLLIVVGPCSVHDPAAAFDYARRLTRLAATVADRLFIVMRVYFEKARTSDGWRGLMNDPGLDRSYRVNDGIFAARQLLLEILSIGMPVACELLDPLMPQYVVDAVSWAAIGARTCQSPIHRQMASGLSMPVGFKNPTDGDLQIAVDAVAVASVPQVFPGLNIDGRPAVFQTQGNPDAHVVLRGSNLRPNYDEASVADLLERLAGAGLPQRVVIDASHGNSGKDHLRQPIVAAELARRISAGERNLVGVMLESFIEGGRQDLEFGRAAQLDYGKSITDSCMSWDTTVEVIESLAQASADRRALVSA